MVLDEFISYKTCYYFLKDDGCLDLTFYKDKTKEYQAFIDGGFSINDFYDIYDKVGYSEKSMVILKTRYGTIVFNRCDDHEFVKKFLKENSKNKPCALFLTYRVSETHSVAISENQEIKRYIYYGEDEHILEGDKTLFEKKNNIDLKLDENGFFEESIDEEFVYNYSVDFMGFNKDEDIEILDFKFYEQEIFARDAEINDSVSNDIIYKIHASLEKQGLMDASINFVRFEDDKRCYIVCAPKIDGETYYLFNRQISNIKNKKEFIKTFNMVLNALANFNYKKFNKVTLEGYFFYRMIEEFNYDMCSAMIDNEDKGAFCFALTVKNKTDLKSDEINKNMVNITRFYPSDVKYLHKYILKHLKPKTTKK